MIGSLKRVVFACMLAFGSLTVVTTWGAVVDDMAKPNEVKAVFRISKVFLDEVTDRKVVADIPLCATVLKFQCTGEIHGEASLDIALQENGQSAAFGITSHGDGQACVRGTRGPIVAYGLAWGPFTTSTRVEFDGRNFTRISTASNVSMSAEVQQIKVCRDRRLGRLAAAGVQPIAEKLIPRAICEAKPIANGYLQEFVNDTADKIIEKLNEKTPIEASINRLFPETDEWVFQMSSSERFLQAAYGPLDAPIPALPSIPSELDEIQLEVWLRSTDEEARALADLSRQPLAKQLAQRYLEATLPEIAALAKERTLQAADDWLVIRIGAPNSDANDDDGND